MIAPAVSDKSTTVRAAQSIPFKLRALRGGIGVLSRLSPSTASAVAEKMFLTPRRRPRPAAERQALAKARRLQLPTAHGPLAAWEWGDDGPRVLLVHGWEGRGAQLSALVAPLTAAGFRVLTFDAPAHGDSPGERSSIFHFAVAIERAAEVFGPLHAIITHSMGGASTLWASRHGPLATRLVTIAPPVDLRDFTAMFSKTLGFPEGVRERMHKRLDARFGVPIAEVRAERLASAMQGPLLVVHDENDREVPISCGEAIANAWPEAQFLRTQGLGHQRILRDAATLQSIVNFVATQEIGRSSVSRDSIRSLK
jgi:pimeloyl-ACP methyl ester carboxylesterase